MVKLAIRKNYFYKSTVGKLMQRT